MFEISFQFPYSVVMPSRENKKKKQISAMQCDIVKPPPNYIKKKICLRSPKMVISQMLPQKEREKEK